MPRQLNIAGKNSNEIYTLFFPSNLMNFCRYDFTLFLEHCADLCRLAARTGEYNVEDVYSIRNSISGCHKYYEQNMRTAFEKIVVDCWIDYLCKQSEISVNTLWQSFMKCRNPFEKAIFGRLSDYRYNRAINEWTNLLKMQEYARTKVDFVFGVHISSTQHAVARANYFDLLFNVAANEQGFPVEELASTGVFSAGRLPNSPFVMNTAAREIARNQLKNIEYREGYKSKKNPDLTDKIAMDAFSAVKNYIPDKNDSMAKTIIKSLTATPQNIYVPGSFKAIIDLEIDAAAKTGAYIQRCARCGDYYIRDEEYDFDYCSRPQREGGTCLELMKIDDPELAGTAIPVKQEQEKEEDTDHEDIKIIYIDKDTVSAKMDSLYKEMAARVNVDLTQRDFSRWYQKELRLKEDILLGEAGEKELNEFIERSRGDEFASKKQEPVFEHKPGIADSEDEEVTENGKTIKKFVFEKVDRETTTSPISSSSHSTLAESEKAAMDAVRKLFDADPAKSRSAAARKGYTQTAQQYDPAGMSSYGYPSNYSGSQTAQTGEAAKPAQTGGFAAARQGYAGAYGVQSNPSYGGANMQYSRYYQQPARSQGTSRIIKGGTASAGTQEFTAKPRTVVIPNGDENKAKRAPADETRRTGTAARVHYREVNGEIEQYIPEEETHISKPAERDTTELFGRKADDPIFEQEEDVKVFTPRRNNIFKSSQTDDYIEPSPYEKLKQPLEEYRNEKLSPKEEEAEVDGQISTDEIFRPASSVISAYKGYNSGGEPVDDAGPEKADFSHILDGITRDDGFSKDENLVDSDGLPVSHKTKHVMNALFGPTKVSPILRVNLDDDDDE